MSSSSVRENILWSRLTVRDTTAQTISRLEEEEGKTAPSSTMATKSKVLNVAGYIFPIPFGQERRQKQSQKIVKIPPSVACWYTIVILWTCLVVLGRILVGCPFYNDDTTTFNRKNAISCKKLSWKKTRNSNRNGGGSPTMKKKRWKEKGKVRVIDTHTHTRRNQVRVTLHLKSSGNGSSRDQSTKGINDQAKKEMKCRIETRTHTHETQQKPCARIQSGLERAHVASLLSSIAFNKSNGAERARRNKNLNEKN